MNRSLLLAAVASILLAGAAAMRLHAEDGAKDAPAAPKVSKEDKVRKLLKLNGTEEMSKAQFDKMLEQFDLIPGLPDGFAAKFREKASSKDFFELTVPIYVKQLDDTTLDATIAFYESDAGKVLASKQPAIFSDSTDAATEWSQKLAMEIAMELAQEGEKPPK